MLDQLLLRAGRRSGIWAQSATSLQYLVLDEFHTYDGAQGTDVVDAAAPARPGAEEPLAGDDFTDASGRAPGPDHAGRHLGDPRRRRRPGRDARLRRHRLRRGVRRRTRSSPSPGSASTSGWATRDRAAAGCGAVDGARLVARVGRRRRRGTTATDRRAPSALAEAVLDALYARRQPGGRGAELVRQSPADRTLLERLAVAARPSCSDARARASCAERATRTAAGGDASPRSSALLSHAAPRPTAARCRSSTCTCGSASSPASTAGGTDAGVPLVRRRRRTARPESTSAAEAVSGPFPALYCRHCGRSGWGVVLSPPTHRPRHQRADIRRATQQTSGSGRCCSRPRR